LGLLLFAGSARTIAQELPAVTHLTEDWWSALYDDVVGELFLVRKDQHELAATLSFLTRHLDLVPGRVVFDQCCGVGSLALPLARAGCAVIGVDQCRGYVDRARAGVTPEHAPCTFFAADAAHFVAPCPCDAGFNWNTGFGNAADDRNAQMLRCAFESLRPGGRFALDYQHVPRILRGFQGCLVHRLPGEHGETIVLRESRADLAAGALVQRWTFLLPDGRRVERHSAVRLYLPHMLGEMLRAAGFVEIAFRGGVNGELLDLDSPRCILIGTRPGP
jgi:SAM-dependent methyltransferase